MRMSDNKDQLSLKFIENETLNVAVTTGQKVVFSPYSHQILVDSHIHIQSNSLCCPITLMWGLTSLKTAGTIGGRGTDKGELIKIQDEWYTNMFLGF